MHYLPPEIWRKVFILLDISKRLDCALVCHNWWNILDTTCLLHNVEIWDNERKFIRFMDMIKRWPHRAAQVQYLYLYNSISKDFDKRQILGIFPNARVINAAASQPGSATHFIEPLEKACTKSTVEELVDSGYCELTKQIINSNLGDRLKKLDLNFRDLVNSSHVVILQLKNLPALEVLSLSCISITVMDLETLHNNLPNIQMLDLIHVNPRISRIPANIKPAALTYLQYNSISHEDQEAIPIWYNYMSRKYTNITEAVYYDSGLEYLDRDITRQTYENGLLRFLQLIGPSTDQQVLYNVPEGINVFEALDNGDSQTHSFTFHACRGGDLFQNLAQSNQSRFVRDFRLIATEIVTPGSLQSLSSLTQIDLDLTSASNRAQVNFTSYLNGFPPSLDRCDISCPVLHLDPESTEPTNIRFLRIDCKYLTVELGDVISNCFPNLVNLGLKGGVVESLDISIQSPDFNRAAFLHPKKDYDCLFSFKSGSQTNSQNYIWHADCIYNIERMGRILQGFPVLSFTCSVEKKIDVSYDSGDGFWIEPLDSPDSDPLDPMNLI